MGRLWRIVDHFEGGFGQSCRACGAVFPAESITYHRYRCPTCGLENWQYEALRALESIGLAYREARPEEGP